MSFDSDLYGQALAGEQCWLRRHGGVRTPIPLQHWLYGESRRVDATIIGWCDAPTVDLGCGPGRLVSALTRRGVPALGVDISAAAVAITRRRGAPALRRDLFDQLPGMGRWGYALLADGNVGIAGDPARLLRRVRRLLDPDGIAIVEFDSPGTGFIKERIRMESRSAVGAWFPWARVGIEQSEPLAAAAGLRTIATAAVRGHHIAWLARS